MRGRSLDAGGPLWVGASGDDDDDDGVSVDIRFETLDVEQRRVALAVHSGERDEDDGALYATSDPIHLYCLLDTGECIPDEAAATAFLADHPWFEEHLQLHMDHVRQRAWRAVAQRDRETAARRVLEGPATGTMLAFHRLFPSDWDLLFGQDEAIYWVVDQYCANPACDCSSVALTLYQLRGAAPPAVLGEAQADLAHERPRLEVETEAARELFGAFWDQHAERLRPRRDEVRRAVLRYSAASAKPASVPSTSRTPRNAACPCGSGKKYKRCCLDARAESAPLHRLTVPRS